MQFDINTDETSGAVTFSGSFDLSYLHLDQYTDQERRLLNRTPEGPAEHLQILSMIYRREFEIAEGQKNAE